MRSLRLCYSSGLSFAAVQVGANEWVQRVWVGSRSAPSPTVCRAAYINGLIFMFEFLCIIS